MQRFKSSQFITFEQLQGLIDISVNILVNFVNKTFFQDLDSFEIEFDSFRHHGISLDDHEHFEYPVIEPCEDIDPSGYLIDFIFRLQSSYFLDLLVYASAELSEIIFVYVEKRLLN